MRTYLLLAILSISFVAGAAAQPALPKEVAAEKHEFISLSQAYMDFHTPAARKWRQEVQVAFEELRVILDGMDSKVDELRRGAFNAFDKTVGQMQHTQLAIDATLTDVLDSHRAGKPSP